MLIYNRKGRVQWVRNGSDRVQNPEEHPKTKPLKTMGNDGGSRPERHERPEMTGNAWIVSFPQNPGCEYARALPCISGRSGGSGRFRATRHCFEMISPRPRLRAFEPGQAVSDPSDRSDFRRKVYGVWRRVAQDMPPRGSFERSQSQAAIAWMNDAGSQHHSGKPPPPLSPDEERAGDAE